MDYDKYLNLPLVRGYHTYLKLERSVSPNTLQAYLEDLAKWLSYLNDAHIDCLEAKLEHFQDFLVDICELGIGTRSQARIISGLKSFYKYLLLENKLEDDPTELLEAPKIGKHLPEVLSLEEIDSMISAIDLSLPQGHRNKAMLELLYSCGLRVSELINLQISNIFMEEMYISVFGKGSKQRLVPMSEPARKNIELWLNDRCLIDVKKGNEDFLFLNRRGTKLSRIMVFKIIKELAQQVGIKKDISPHTFRHSFATHLLEGGANLRAIQEMLGHESIMTTQIYTHIDMNFLRSEVLQYHPMNRKKD